MTTPTTGRSEAVTERAPCADATITPAPSDASEDDAFFSRMTLARRYLESLGVVAFPRASSVAGFAEVM